MVGDAGHGVRFGWCWGLTRLVTFLGSLIKSCLNFGLCVGYDSLPRFLLSLFLSFFFGKFGLLLGFFLLLFVLLLLLNLCLEVWVVKGFFD